MARSTSLANLAPRAPAPPAQHKRTNGFHSSLFVGQHREIKPEVMDNPRLESTRHVAALNGLARINVLGRTAGILWRPLKKLALERRSRRLRVLDLATGSGDVPLALWRKASRADIALDITGADVSRRALALARQRAAKEGARVNFFELNVVKENLPRDYDVVMTSQFLHHLTNHQAVELLGKMKRAARQAVLVQDLARRSGGLWLAYLASRLFSTSDVVRTDALLSVRAAFTIEEARQLAERAGLEGAAVRKRWPCRYLLEWRRAA
jgi:SAM-dependent methyltransferase